MAERIAQDILGAAGLDYNVEHNTTNLDEAADLAAAHFAVERATNPDADDLAAYLIGSTRGKIVDKSFEQYCARLAHDYFKDNGLRNHRTNNTLFDEAYEITLNSIAARGARNSAQRIRQLHIANTSTQLATYEDRANCVERFFGIRRYELISTTTDPLNCHAPSQYPERTSWTEVVCKTAAVACIATAGVYLASKLLTSALLPRVEVALTDQPVRTSIITPLAQRQLLQLTTDAIKKSSLKTLVTDQGTILLDSTDLRDTFENSSGPLILGLLNNTYSRCLQRASGAITQMCSKHFVNGESPPRL